MAYSSLTSYFKTLWAMVHHHKWTVSEIENLTPWERDIYVEMTAQYIQEQEAAMQMQQQSLNI
jgi:hypothetical protein